MSPEQWEDQHRIPKGHSKVRDPVLCCGAGIPLHEINFVAEYWTRVFEGFVEQHRRSGNGEPLFPGSCTLLSASLPFPTFPSSLPLHSSSPALCLLPSLLFLLLPSPLPYPPHCSPFPFLFQGPDTEPRPGLQPPHKVPGSVAASPPSMLPPLTSPLPSPPPLHLPPPLPPFFFTSLASPFFSVVSP